MKKLLTLLLAALLLPACAFGAGAQVQRVDPGAFDVPDNAAMAFLRDMGVGWNLGNTFDAYRDGVRMDEMDMETAWHGVRTEQRHIQALKDAGFGTLRIPVSWHNHVTGPDFTISAAWLDRVQQVVDWGMEAGLYVILNIHHDDAKEYYYPSAACYENSARYVSSVWGQLAERFRDYDQHLIFESINEPRLKGHQNEWYYSSLVADCRESADCINRLNQVFVDTVRASGGQNADRYLMVPGYDASPDGAVGAAFALPKDSADNRLIVSVHAYTPYSFALQDGGQAGFSIGSRRQTGEITGFMNKLYRTFVQKGIPVVIGEFGARDKGGNLQDRVDFASFYTAHALARNMPCCWWDNNSFSGSGENFGLLRRLKNQWMYPEIVEAMTQYVKPD